MQFPAGMKVPRYLFLHKRDSFVLLSLKEKEPKMVTREELENLGFRPSGDSSVKRQKLLVRISHVKFFVEKVSKYHY